MVAILLEAGQPRPGERCLEIGAGSGWLAALLGHLVGPEGHVTAVEIVPELAKRAADNVQQAGLTNVTITKGDGSLGAAQGAPYDLIIASCAAPQIPDPLVKQLAQDGRMLVPVGDRSRQHLLRVRRAGDRLATEDLGGCAFVPLVGEYGF